MTRRKSKSTIEAIGTSRAGLLVALILAMAVFANADAQTVQPTAEQLRMINQLPAAQREQALALLRQAQTQAGSDTAAEAAQDLAELRRVPARQTSSAQQSASRRAAAHSRIILTFTPKEEFSSGARLEDPVQSELRGSHHFTLDDAGVLTVKGLQSVPLLGLTEQAIVDRLSAEPVFSPFEIQARILEIQPTGVEALQLFGYDLFQNNEVGFDPPMAGPVPPDYMLGPGDSIRVQLFGNVNGVYEFDVGRDGVVNLPELGPVTVTGLSFSELRQDLKDRVDRMLIGTQVSVTMGQLRTLRVFVLGDAARPGSYVVSSLATISSALYHSGGLSEIGSMRNIALKRQGKAIATLDLYDLLLHGDTSGDERLQSGDVIFVPPIGNTIGIGGAVRRPAIYEVKDRSTVADVIRLAGGLDSEAFLEAARLERIDPERGRIVLNVGASPDTVVVRNGDTLVIPKVLPEVRDAVVLSGHVQRPGTYQWRPGMRIAELLPSALDLAPGADANYILIRRESSSDRSVTTVSADLSAALQNPAGPANVLLQSRDSVHVFSFEYGRQRIIAPILDELRLQAQFGSPSSEVSIGGQVRAPGKYPLEAGMRVSQLIRAGGGMREGAYAHDAELTRFAVIDGRYGVKEVIDVDLDAVLRGDLSADFELAAHDVLSISLVPDWNVKWSVTIEGEVRFPGDYQILQGETLSQLLDRAGGLTENAFPQGAVFLRESLREREREQIEILASHMEADLAAMSLESLDTTGNLAMQTGKSLLTQLRNAEPVGRLVIDLEPLSHHAAGQRSPVGDIELRDGDRLLIPVVSQEVTVIGETQQPTSHLYQPGLTRDDYIKLSGGLTRRADKKLIYVVRASGAVVTSNQSKWFGRGGAVPIRPGDTVVVPLETDRIRPLTFWTNVTQILYQGAIAVAAIKTFDK